MDGGASAVSHRAEAWQNKAHSRTYHDHRAVHAPVLVVAHLHSKWSIYMDHLRPSLCYNRVIIFALGSWNLQLNSTFLK